ncbi:hypothetical protein ASG54_22260 [Aureimonas sp. Leaf460]|nr:hypothetical protein ASG62_15690 [Aureimonas sp. Leaf427]KQT70659.1 hypothetical protein ASG54_22260 [Aureimonas sp. Leaf460]
MNQTFGPVRLFETPDNPLPQGIVAGTVTTRDRVALRFALIPSRLPATRGTVILLQGRNEAIEKYFETIDDLTALGYMVATFDWRGQGGSARLLKRSRLGHVTSFAAYAEDLEAVFREVVLPDCRGPFVILAHSMGGAVAMLAAPRLLNRVERIVCAAPLISLPESGPDPRRLLAGTTAMRWMGLGRVPMPSPARAKGPPSIATSFLTGDERRLRRNTALVETAPQLFVGHPTAAWLRAATATMRHLDDSDVIAGLQVPTLFVTAGADRVVSSTAAERLAWRMRSGHSITLPGARHELMQEADRHRAPFLAAFDAFAGGALPLE